MNQWEISVGGATQCNDAQIENCTILLHHKQSLSLKLSKITNSHWKRPQISVSVNDLFECMMKITSMSSPTRHTELSLWTAAALGFSDTQRLLSKGHNSDKNKDWAQNYSWPARPIRPALITSKTPCQNTSDITGHVSLIHTHKIIQFISLSVCVITGLERMEWEETRRKMNRQITERKNNRHGKMERKCFLSQGMKPKPSCINVQPYKGVEAILNLISMIMNIN